MYLLKGNLTILKSCSNTLYVCCRESLLDQTTNDGASIPVVNDNINDTA